MHGQFEFGKDFIAKLSNEEGLTQCAFQSKAGNIDGVAWREVRNQLEDIRANALAHPSFDQRSRCLPSSASLLPSLPAHEQQQLDEEPDGQKSILTNLVEPCFDEDGGTAPDSLLRELVDAPEAQLEVLLKVARSELLQEIVSQLAHLDEKGSQGLLDFLQSQFVPTSPLQRVAERRAKYPIDGE